MSNFDNMYLKKKVTELKSSEDLEDFFVYTKLAEVHDFVIIRKESTLNEEENDVVSVTKDEFSKKYYSLKDFFKNAIFIGSSGYYDYPGNALDKHIYEDWVVLYRDDNNEFIYDDIFKRFIIKHVYHRVDEFVPLNTDIEVPDYDIQRYIK